MTTLLVLCCFSVLLTGVFGADVAVSVMNGDDVILPNTYKINEDDELDWKFKGDIIAGTSQSEQTDKRFSGRLKFSKGSLTIKNIRIEDSGVYTLQLSGRRTRTFNVTVSDQVIKVSVVKGGSFSLPTGDKIQTHDVEWRHNGTELTNDRFPNTNVNTRTGELKITNIKPEQSGEYKVKINGNNLILHKTFCVIINGKEKPESGTEGESISLNFDNGPQADDVIEWMFNSTLIAKVNRRISPHPHFPLERFKDRLNLNSHDSLIIMKLKTEDSGPYDVNIIHSKHIIHKRFNLTVTKRFPFWGWILVGLAVPVLLMLCILALRYRYCSKKCKKAQQQEIRINKFQEEKKNVMQEEPVFQHE